MMSAAYVCELVANLSSATICQLFYVLSAAAVLAVAAAPNSAQRLLTQYGARSSGNASASVSSQDRKDTGRELDNNNNNALSVRFITWLTSVGKVPHSWFIHFYILSLSCTVFWAIQFLTKGIVLELIVRNQPSNLTSSMTIGQVILVWFLMGLQGARRLYEYLAVLRPSSSRMWVVHWLLGNAFYLFTSVSLWVEGSASILYSDRKCPDIEFPSLKSIIASSVFLTAWCMQYQCHRQLSGLKKYSFPEDGLFQYLVCPHYTCECLLYLSMAVIAAPEGQLYNQTLACAVLFVSINLGVTANGTKQWYSEKFGSKVQGKWKMIPVVF
ncbi:3-oxo-5-alpha-steroid 4-dehydrogenase [Xylariaceae sp. AK1471]|nr:3-oxo-5-alpha-steroid 4-dehydrogenase [Xylariaceae sp. AK1471]